MKMNKRILPASWAALNQHQAGQKYRPGNGTEGEIFTHHWCHRCANHTDKNQSSTCGILMLTRFHDVDAAEYPQEWQYDTDGQPCCTAFIERVIDTPVQCTRCRNKHRLSERIEVREKSGLSTIEVCPRCNGKSYYDMSPTVAWCWASGIIEFGESAPKGSIPIASGPESHLAGLIKTRAWQGRDSYQGKLLVPGVVEADSPESKLKALRDWLIRSRSLATYVRPKNSIQFTHPDELPVEVCHEKN